MKKRIIISMLMTLLFFNCSYVKATSDYDSKDLSDYFGTKKACTRDGSENDCRNGNEYKFYLKMYDLYFLYKNKYNVKLDLPLIMSTLYYNDEQLPTVFEKNLNDYDRNAVKDTSQVTNLDWEYDYKNMNGYYYLNADDNRFDMQILAKNMVKKKITYKCSDGSNGEALDIETSNYSNETLKCENGNYEASTVNATYELDTEKYDEFLLEYIKLKYHTKGKGVGCMQSSSTTDGNILIGDSRFVAMCDNYDLCGNDKYFAKVGEGYNWFTNTVIEEVNSYLKSNSNSKYNIFINLGVNDLDNYEKYIQKYNELASGDWKNHNIYFVSVNPTQGSYSHLNDKINKFNTNVKNGVKSSNINYCDVSSKLSSESIVTTDGLHYDKDTSKKIYDYMKSCALETTSNLSCEDGNYVGNLQFMTGSFGKIYYYNQGDYATPGSYGGFGSIASHGCGPTSLAIVVSSMLNQAHDPVELTNYVCSIGGCTDAGTVWDAITKTPAHYGLNVTRTGDTQEVINALGNGKSLVIALMCPGHFTSSGHFITLTGSNSNGQVTVADPGNRNNNHEWDFNTVAEETCPGGGQPYWIITK